MDHLARRDVNPERFAKLEKELVRGKSELVRISQSATVPQADLVSDSEVKSITRDVTANRLALPRARDTPTIS